MRRAAPLLALAAWACGCAHNRLAPGPYKDGYAVEVRAASAPEARCAAVAQFFDLYLSSEAAAGSGALLDEKILKKPEAFVVRERAEGAGPVTLRALVDYAKLGRALLALGLVKPEGVKGRPTVRLSLTESGPGSGRAADTLRRRLAERGYLPVEAGEAEITLRGTAQSEAAPDPRLAGYGSSKAVVRAEAVQRATARTVAAVTQEAAAVDVNEAAAGAKALENAGELAADKIAAALGSLYQERLEFTVTVYSLGNLDRCRQFLAALRGMPRFAGAYLDAVSGSDARFKLYAEKMGADELTVELLKLRAFRLEVRQVDPDFNAVEFSSGEAY